MADILSYTLTLISIGLLSFIISYWSETGGKGFVISLFWFSCFFWYADMVDLWFIIVLLIFSIVILLISTSQQQQIQKEVIA